MKTARRKMPRSRVTGRLISNEAPCRFDRTETIEIVMSAARKTNELLRFMREREQTLSEQDRNGKIIGAMHHEQRHRDARDPFVGTKLVAHEQAHRHVAECQC